MEILLLRTGNVSWSELSGFLGCLDSARRKSVLKKANDSDRINSLLSRLLMLSELEKRTKIPRKKLAFTLGAYGKPYMRIIDGRTYEVDADSMEEALYRM